MAPPDAQREARAGLYMTHASVNGTFTINGTERDLQTSWAELTYLFTSEWTQNAFPVIDVREDGANDDEVIVVRSGESTTINVDILNEMWSTPNVKVQMYVSSDNGVPIAQIDINNVKLNAQDEKGVPIPKTVSITWKPSQYAPSGEHTMSINVIEANNDYSTIETRVKIIQENILPTIFFSFFDGYGWIASLAGIFFLVYAGSYYRKNQLKKSGDTYTTAGEADIMALLGETTTQNVRGEFSNKKCTYDEIVNERCSHIQSKNWTCDPQNKTCWYVPKK